MEQVHYVKLCRKELFLQGNKFGPVSYKVWYPTCNFQIHHPTDTTLRKKSSLRPKKCEVIYSCRHLMIKLRFEFNISYTTCRSTRLANDKGISPLSPELSM